MAKAGGEFEIMSITTQRGDSGETDLMYGRRIPKTHPRLVACGDADELNAALGVARVIATRDRVRATVSARQHELIAVMGELATDDADINRYQTDGYPCVTASIVDALTTEIHAIEAEMNERFIDWATPGADTTPCGAALDLARAVCRRAERSAVAAAPANPEIIRYLNRLSDFLWLLARWEARAAKGIG
jgi:cob(I)alamin adenosyltransferase